MTLGGAVSYMDAATFHKCLKFPSLIFDYLSQLKLKKSRYFVYIFELCYIYTVIAHAHKLIVLQRMLLRWVWMKSISFLLAREVTVTIFLVHVPDMRYC